MGLCLIIERSLKRELEKFQLIVPHSGKQASLGREDENTLAKFMREGDPRGKVQGQVDQ